MGNEGRKEWRRMIAVQSTMMRWTRNRKLIALLEEIRALNTLTTPISVQKSVKETRREDAFLID